MRRTLTAYPKKLSTEGQRIECMFAFMRERHFVYLRRRQGLPAPWTTDPVLQQYRFCNIYRELDKVTQWICKNLLGPNKNHPDLWWYAVLARFFNKPESLEYALKSGVVNVDNFSPQKFQKTMEKYRSEIGPVFNSAYIINGISKPGSSGQSKIAMIAFDVLRDMLEEKEALREAIKAKSYKGFLEVLSGFHGMGPFMANQVGVDLTYFPSALKGAKDIDSVISPGPGTCKGIRFLMGQQGFAEKSPISKDDQFHYMELVRKLSYNDKYWPIKSHSGTMYTGFVPLSMPNVSNSFCETSKRSAIELGLRDRLKNGYSGLGVQTDLF